MEMVNLNQQQTLPIALDWVNLLDRMAKGILSY